MKSVCVIVQNPYEMDIRVRRKAEALVTAGYSVDAIALRSAKSPEKEFTLNGVKVYTISLGKMRGSLVRYAFEYLTFFVLASWKLSRLMRTRKYAIVDINTLPDFLVFAAWWTRRKGAKVVLDMHEITPEFFMSKYGVSESHWLVRLSTFLERVSFRYADHVLTINEPIQRLLMSRGLEAKKATIVMNAADEAIFSNATFVPASEPLDKKFIMMYHGTLTRIYGLDIAIEAFGRVHKEMPGAQIWILGNGPEKNNLQELARKLEIQEKVRFIGSVLPQEIPNWLGRCDVGILPTRRDVFLDYSFSNKLSEYVICKKPVISARLKTIQHYFTDEALAFFEPNNAADLATQMIRVYRDGDLRNRLANRAKSEYAPISWAVMKQRYLKAMEDLGGCAVDAGGFSCSDRTKGFTDGIKSRQEGTVRATAASGAKLCEREGRE